MADTPRLPGTLDLLFHQGASLGSERGDGLQSRIRRAAGALPAIAQGVLDPALCRLESQGLVESGSAVADGRRKATCHTPTRAESARPARDVDTWRRRSQAMDAAPGANRAGLAS